MLGHFGNETPRQWRIESGCPSEGWQHEGWQLHGRDWNRAIPCPFQSRACRSSEEGSGADCKGAQRICQDRRKGLVRPNIKVKVRERTSVRSLTYNLGERRKREERA